MTLATFQLLCLAVLALAYGLRLATAAEPARALAGIAALAAAAWAGEQSCITLYGFYEYADGWWGRLGDVPPLVPLIWPLVVLSARDVGRELWGDPGPVRGALRTAALVALDASLMEVVSVAAGLWRWSEAGYLGVPVIGMVGWGCFALGASLALDGARRPGRRLHLVALPIVAPAVTHALLLALWWGALRWGLRGDLGPWAVAGFAAPALAAAAAVLRVRSRARLAPATTAARIAASLAFLALLASLGGPRAPLLWAHTGLVALPYLLALRLSSGDPRPAA